MKKLLVYCKMFAFFKAIFTSCSLFFYAKLTELRSSSCYSQVDFGLELFLSKKLSLPISVN